MFFFKVHTYYEYTELKFRSFCLKFQPDTSGTNMFLDDNVIYLNHPISASPHEIKQAHLHGTSMQTFSWIYSHSCGPNLYLFIRLQPNIANVRMNVAACKNADACNLVFRLSATYDRVRRLLCIMGVAHLYSDCC